MSDDEVEVTLKADVKSMVTSLEKAVIEAAPFKTHYFDESGYAYDKTQTGYYRYKEHTNPYDHEPVYTEVHDGDLIVIPKEGVYGFLYEAWPIAYVPDPPQDPSKSGHLHQLVGDPEEFLKSYPKYVGVYEAAHQLYAMHHSDWNPNREKE
jgi:hypothetical protein